MAALISSSADNGLEYVHFSKHMQINLIPGGQPVCTLGYEERPTWTVRN